MEERSVFIHEFVTGGGLAGEELPESWAAEGRAMRKALAEDFASLPGVSVTMTLDARLPAEPGPWRVVRVGPGEEPSTFSHLAAENDYTLCVAPETDRILEQRARIIEQVGGRSLGSQPDAIALYANKLLTAAHLHKIGIETPESIRIVLASGLPRDFSYPAVLKPIDGAGSTDTFFVESCDDLPAGALVMRDAVLQPFVPGQAMSAAFLIGEEGEAWLVGFAEQNVERVGRRFSYRGGRVPATIDDVGDLSAALFEILQSMPGLRGWIGVDFVWHPSSGKTTILEINPRLTTSYVGWRELVSERGILARRWLDSFAPANRHWASTTSGTLRR